MSLATDVDESVDDFLAHYGVLGMHWGKRKPSSTIAEAAGLTSGRTPRDRHGNVKKPSYARELLLGSWANSKKRYTDPRALKQRTTAGKLWGAAFLTGAGATALTGVAMLSKNPSVVSGTSSVSSLLRSGAGAVGLGSLVFGIAAARNERVSRANHGS